MERPIHMEFDRITCHIRCDDGQRLVDYARFLEKQNQELKTPMDRRQYEEDLKERRKRHLAAINAQNDFNWRPCMHDQCEQCHGTGVTTTGQQCVHMISCPCPKCSPTM